MLQNRDSQQTPSTTTFGLTFKLNMSAILVAMFDGSHYQKSQKLLPWLKEEYLLHLCAVSSCSVLCLHALSSVLSLPLFLKYWLFFNKMHME